MVGASIQTQDTDLVATIRGLLKDILNQDDVDAILVPQKLPMKDRIMPALISDPEKMDGVDPLAPVFPLNAARIVSRLARKPIGGQVVVVLRPCEIRAFIELVKLKQGRMDDLIIVGIDCLGAYSNTDFFKLIDTHGDGLTRKFYEAALSGKGTAIEGIDVANACRVCEKPIPTNADILIGLIGVDTSKQIWINGQTEKGEKLVNALKLKNAEEPAGRREAVESLINERIIRRDDMFAATRDTVNNLEKLTRYLANCVNCYNCRVACPVCYCRECVFVTDVFVHEPSQFMQWAVRKGTIKMPTDTVFFHLTRLAHMSTACVGCGQCSNACPNDIPLMELFRTVAHQTQAAFDYEAGRSLDEAPPLSEFKADEFKDVVGISDFRKEGAA